MKSHPTSIPDVLLLEPVIYGDERGFFMESYNSDEFRKIVRHDVMFVQDNHSRSQHGVLRGLHYQISHAQDKLVRVIKGEVFDVAVDLRRSSISFGHWTGEVLSSDNNRQMWIPKGFAHGFYVISGYAEVLYKTSDYHAPEYERCIAWNDPDLGIEWPLKGDPLLSEKDANAGRFRNAETFA